MEKKEIIKNEELTTKYNRIDFNNSMTIMTYGEDLLKEMNTYMDKTATLLSSQQTEEFDFDEMLEKIDGFSNYLEKKPDKEIKGLLPIMGNALKSAKEKIEKTIFGKDLYTDTYSDQYLRVKEDIDAIEQAIEKKKTEVLSLIEIENSTIETQQRYAIELDTLIKLGENDLKEFKDKVELLSEDENNTDLVNISNQQIVLLERKLEALRKSLISIKSRILQNIQKRNTDMSLVISYTEYNTTAIHDLRADTESMVTTKMQKDNLNEMKRINEITNNSMQKNSNIIVKNIEEANKLMTDGNITMKTLQVLTDNARKGIDLIKQGYESIELEREKNAPIIANMLESFDHLNEETIDIIEKINPEKTLVPKK